MWSAVSGIELHAALSSLQPWLPDRGPQSAAALIFTQRRRSPRPSERAHPLGLHRQRQRSVSGQQVRTAASWQRSPNRAVIHQVLQQICSKSRIRAHPGARGNSRRQRTNRLLTGAFTSTRIFAEHDGIENIDQMFSSEFKMLWRRCMGVEPTYEQEAARTTVLKTAAALFQAGPVWPTRYLLNSNSGPTGRRVGPR